MIKSYQIIQKKKEKSLKILREDCFKRLKKYEKYEKILGKRNSFSKTDHDATFMRMKDDYMKNGQLKPAYNVQTGTENQFILWYSIHQKTTDTSFLIPHLKRLESKLKKLPTTLICDSGYGSEENYSFIEKKQLGNYVKFNYFHKEKTRKFQKNKFRVENLVYDSTFDEYTCPASKKLKYIYTKKYTTDNGYETSRRIYECENCEDCNYRIDCHRSKYNRKISVSPILNQFKENARKNLNSEKGKELRSLRGVEVESVFGHIKHNRRFKRFMLRGLKKVQTEWGLISMAHNMIKMSAIQNQKS